ncbi:hypothetical protein LZ578_04965 [Jeotgalibaca sp. MA1X17-3]|uniref:hypothetical protein n=1 Tax=Jeotgalibaca sp. MA1X17-3 TaxID=2908211 RepID=UPI001F38469C|nr:hypothetical protein [Jeotgalibaca sp. MA1X17-3]UJF16459.1 hypothetical protein LZ578_04965 [Jeotgalibaca sp. MA1X17-3]
MEEYEEEANNKRKNYIEEVEEEKEYFIKRLRMELGKNAVQIASKILATISSKELEDEVYKSFINDLVHINENVPNKEILDESRNINLYSSKELSKDEKKI